MGVNIGTETNISHGVCPECKEKLKRDVLRINAR